MKKKITIVFFALTIPLLALSKIHAGGAVNPKQVEIKTTRDLKQYMSQFGSLVAGLEILKVKEKTPDWPVITLTLQEMNKTLAAMQAADKRQAYKNFTDDLEKELTRLKSMEQAKDPKIYDQFDSLTNACFRCHAAHRPTDFLKSPPIGMRENPRLWKGPSSLNP